MIYLLRIFQILYLQLSTTPQTTIRNSNNVHQANARSSLCYDSFLLSVVRGWNNIPDEQRNDTVMAFNNVLSHDKPVDPKHDLFGNRKEYILHTRLRTNCSVLNYDLYLKNIIDSPLCRCNNIETVIYFFLDCPIYNNQRITLMQTGSCFCAITLKTLLYGNSFFSRQTNNDILEAVQHFLKKTKCLEALRYS